MRISFSSFLGFIPWRFGGASATRGSMSAWRFWESFPRWGQYTSKNNLLNGGLITTGTDTWTCWFSTASIGPTKRKPIADDKGLAIELTATPKTTQGFHPPYIATTEMEHLPMYTASARPGACSGAELSIVLFSASKLKDLVTLSQAPLEGNAQPILYLRLR